MVLFLPGPGGGEEIDHGYKGKGSLLHLITDKEGKPLWMTTTSAKGNDSDERRQEMLKRGYVPIIGYRKNRKERVKTKEIYNYFGIAKKR
jgi:hypothetical protein